MTRCWRVVAATVIAAAVVLFSGGSAGAHAKLEQTSPRGGETVTVFPSQVTLEFSEPIEASFAGIQVFDSDEVRVEASPADVSGSTIRLPLPPQSRSGDYVVVFRVLSADGHPVESRFTFTFEPPAPPTSEPGSPSTTTTASRGPIDVELQGASGAVRFGVWAARVVDYAALAFLLGVAAALVWVFQPDEKSRRRFGWLAIVGGITLVAAAGALFALGLANAAAIGVLDLRPALAGEFLGTRFGSVIAGQAGLGVVAAVAGTLLQRGTRRFEWVVAGAAVVAAAGPALWGHAGTDELAVLAVPVDWLHVVAAGAWLGGLLLVARSVPSGDIDRDAVQRFSRLAGAAVAAVVATGVVSTLLHLGRLGNLRDTSWGRWVVVKTLLYGVVAAAGFVMRRRVVPTFGRGGRSGTTFARVAAAEAALMLGALAVAGQLASIVPADAEEASRVQSVLAALGDGQLNMTIDPASVGENLVHLYVFDRQGQVDGTAANPRLTFQRNGVTVIARLLTSGPGHFTGVDVELPSAGPWEATFAVDTAAGRQTATASVLVR